MYLLPIFSTRYKIKKQQNETPRIDDKYLEEQYIVHPVPILYLSPSIIFFIVSYSKSHLGLIDVF